MPYHVAHEADLVWEERDPMPGDSAGRSQASITDAAHLEHSRARLWRYPPHTRGRRHADPDQEEVFVPLKGTLTMLLEDPPQRVDVGPGELVAVHPNTPLQVRNESDGELVLLIYGAPTEHGNAVFLDDIRTL